MAKYIRVFAMGIKSVLELRKLENKSVYMLKVKMLFVHQLRVLCFDQLLYVSYKYVKVSIPVKTRHSSE